MTFLAELQRRKVFRIGAAYVVAAWIAVQAASIAFPAFEAPPWALRVFILLLLLGFPVALVTAWVYELTPAGMTVERGRGTRYVYAASAAFAALALAWYFVGASMRSEADRQAVTPGAKAAASAEPAHATSDPIVSPAKPAPQKSIAVLPFADLSATHDQEYFSDGMADEILDALCHIKELKVAGRSSSFRFRGQNEDLRRIGEALGVAHILEGSVRKQGDKVRITAQLIEAGSGFHLWSQTYDGDLEDVFELQERIARAITEQLSVVLDSEEQQRLVPVATDNPQAYSLYLQASAVYNRRDGARFKDAIANLEQALQLDPGFARAQARLASLHVLAPLFTRVDLDESLIAAEHSARTAMELDPGLAEPHAAVALAYESRRHFVESRKEFERALELEPNDPATRFWLSSSLLSTGYRRQGTEMLDQVLALDPMLPIALNWRANVYFEDGDLDHAQALYQRAADLGMVFASGGLGQISRARGNTTLANEQTVAALRGILVGIRKEEQLQAIAAAYGDDPQARARGLAIVDDYLASDPQVLDGMVLRLLIRFGEPARALTLGQDEPASNDGSFFRMVMGREFSELRRLPEFTEFTRRTGLTKLWEVYGAPDGCERLAAEQFHCE